ncbi:MAG: D-alanine--D-alanine ligase family protein [Bacteroidota bacterium]
MKTKINLFLLCGGQSPEHSISLRSAKNIYEALDKSAYNIFILGISRTGEWYLVDSADMEGEIIPSNQRITLAPGASAPFILNGSSLPQCDVCFPVLHGPNGEDGTVQGLLQLLKVPFVGSGVMSSSMTMDKDVTKRLLISAGIKVAPGSVFHRHSSIPLYDQLAKELGSTLFIKPANMGSSVGVHRVTSQEQLDNGLADAFKYDHKVIIEQQVEGRELECAVKGNASVKCSGVGEVVASDFYSYDEKYAQHSRAKTIIPANVTQKELEELKKTAIEAYKALECKGLARVDMFLTGHGDVLVNEINSLPGFTSISMYPKLWEQEGFAYSDLLDELIELALQID